MYFKATGWVPEFKWDKLAFKDIFGFGVYTSATNVSNYLINNIDYLLIGKLLSAQALGVYTFAFVLTDTFRSRLMAVTNNVMYPLYGKKQSNPESLKKYYLNVVNYNSIIVYPIMIFMLALGQPFIIQVFGIKWEASIPPLQILSLSVMVHMLVNSNTALVRGMGRPDLEMKLQLIKAVIFVPMLSAGIYFYGITGAAWAILINKVIAVAIAQYTFNKLIHIKMGTMEFLSAIRTPALAGGISYLFVYVIYNFLHLNYILCGVLLFIIYAFLVWLQMGNEIRMQIKSLKLSNKVTY
jgi:O-antigen/teichoic acid export membrane protein